MSSCPDQKSAAAVRKTAGRQSAAMERVEKGVAKEETERAEKAVEAEEDAGAGKERGTLNENSGCQYQSSCFRNHDVSGVGNAGDFFLSHARRRSDAEDRPA